MEIRKNKEVAILLKKLFLLFLPFLLFLSFPLLVLFRAGEFYSIDKIIEKQKSKDKIILLGLAYTNPVEYYKLKSVIRRRPEVITLGTSRVMEFRSQFFKRQINFYNAGGAVAQIRHFQAFLDQIPAGQEPKIIIIGLDQYFFNRNWKQSKDDNILNRYQSTTEKSSILMRNFLSIYRDFYSKKFNLESLMGDTDAKIGLNAIVNNSGFINDGSHNLHNTIDSPVTTLPSHEDYLFKNTLSRIQKGISRFEYASTVAPESIEELNLFLKKCKERNIYVIGFLPPYAPLIFDKMIAMGEKYSYLLKIYPAVAPIFNNHNYRLYNFSDLTSLGSSDKEVLDGFHGSEKAYLRLFIKMAEADSILLQKTDLVYLKKKLLNTKGNITVFSE